MNAQKPLRILLVDDHLSIRRELVLMLTEECIANCREASGRQEALEIIDEEVPDLALVDLSLGEEDGLALVAELHSREIPVLVCSLHEESRYVTRALQAGARGYITKREAAQDLARAIHDIMEGWVLISPRAANDLPECPFQPQLGAPARKRREEDNIGT
ncbi:MAG: response regulator [Armatimonadota bacterium]